MEIQYYEHTCLCGCDKQIEIKKWHKYNGIPKFISGHQFRGENNPFYGKKQDEKVRKEISEKAKERFQNPEKHPMYGRHHTEETRKKQSEAHKGGISWNKGLTKENNKIIYEAAKKSSKSHKGLNSGEKNYFYGKSFLKEEHPNWVGGYSHKDYGKGFTKYLKNYIKNRDLNVCQTPNCMNTENLHIHHIDYDKTNNNPENLITLCRGCHMKTNNKKNREHWTEFYQNIMINRIVECLL